MIKGIGVDIVNIKRVKKYIEDPSFIKYTFTQKENEIAYTKSNKASYYASLFAIKEAFFKAVNQLIDKKIDFRNIECLNDENGKPYINIESIKEIVEETNINNIHISISNEDSYTIAFVAVE